MLCAVNFVFPGQHSIAGVAKMRLVSRMWLFELSKNLYICFAKCRNIVKWYCGSLLRVKYYFCKSFQKELCHRSV